MTRYQTPMMGRWQSHKQKIKQSQEKVSGFSSAWLLPPPSPLPLLGEQDQAECEVLQKNLSWRIHPGLGKTNLEITQSVKQRFSNLYAKLLGKLANIHIPSAFPPVDLGPRNWHFNKHRKMIPMKLSMLVKLENKEHNLAAALLNLGSASDLLRSFKKNLDVSTSVLSKLREWQNAL